MQTPFHLDKLSMFLLQLAANKGISATHCGKTADYRYKPSKVLWQVLTPRVSSAYQHMFMQVSLHKSHVLWGCGGSSECEKLLRDTDCWKDYITALFILQTGALNLLEYGKGLESMDWGGGSAREKGRMWKPEHGKGELVAWEENSNRQSVRMQELGSWGLGLLATPELEFHVQFLTNSMSHYLMLNEGPACHRPCCAEQHECTSLTHSHELSL